MRTTACFVGVALWAASLLPVFAQDATKPDEAKTPAAAKPDEKAAYASDIKPEAVWDGRKLVPFRALDFPKMVKAADADFMEDGEYILGLTINGESRAYPTRFISWHHVINDKVGKPEMGGEAFVTVTY